MLIFIFFFTLLISFEVYKFAGKEQYKTWEKPLWKSLIYWGSILFISVIFNVIMYSNNSDAYNLSSYINNDSAELLIFFALSCLTIHLLSPSLFGEKIRVIINRFIKSSTDKKPREKAVSEDNPIGYGELSSSKVSNIYSAEKAKSFPENLKDSQEKEFEIFLNTLCWLTFIFVFFTTTFFATIGYVTGHNGIILIGEKYSNTKEQLNYIASIMLIITLPIALRQILYYLTKLKKSSSISDNNLKMNSVRYQKYLLVQNRLSKANKRL
jgi:hypothetical protein